MVHGKKLWSMISCRCHITPVNRTLEELRNRMKRPLFGFRWLRKLGRSFVVIMIEFQKERWTWASFIFVEFLRWLTTTKATPSSGADSFLQKRPDTSWRALVQTTSLRAWSCTTADSKQAIAISFWKSLTLKATKYSSSKIFGGRRLGMERAAILKIHSGQKN